MQSGGMVSVPERKAPDAGGNSDIAKTGRGIKGFGGGSMSPSLEGNDSIQKGAPKAPIKGFSGGGVLGGKI